METYLGDDGFLAIASSVKNLKALQVGISDDEAVTRKGIQALAEAIKNRKDTVNKLT